MGEVMATTKPTKKCANPTCDCVPEDGSKYCSAHCEGAGDSTELVCRCGHSCCSADITTELLKPGSSPAPPRIGHI